MKKWVMGAVFTVLPMQSFGSTEWGVKELNLAQDISMETLQKAEGQSAIDNIAGYSVDKNVQGTGAKIRITYKKNGQSINKSYFCHQHEGEEIDCH